MSHEWFELTAVFDENFEKRKVYKSYNNKIERLWGCRCSYCVVVHGPLFVRVIAVGATLPKELSVCLLLLQKRSCNGNDRLYTYPLCRAERG
jgi:hypothetical protein